MNTNKINHEQNFIDEDFLEFKGIFSRHYLKAELPGSDYLPKDKDILSIFEQCRTHFLRVQKVQRALNAKKSGLNESDTETELIDKILPLLGFHFLKRSRQATGVPDYVLFADEALKEKALPLPEKDRYQSAVSLLEAKAFHINLNRISKEDTPGVSYHRQIHVYLQDAKSQTERQFFNWGILTNGAKWRLYSQDVRTDRYFELDLEVALQNLNSFKYFLSLFDRRAFILDDDGHCRLDYLRKESQARQEKLETDLRKRIFTLVEILAQGFVSIPSNNITDHDLPKVYDACLILLYRLLFILYAEGKELLPVREHGYGARKAYREEYALRRYQAILRQRQWIPEDDAFKTYWKDIGNIFDLINGTDEHVSKRLDIPRYNGGLFDPERHPELMMWKLGNWTMQEVLKGLIFTPLPSTSDQTIKVNFQETIDYATLEVQRLGSIYEGLLEWKFDRINGNIKLVPTSEKRKETGSYYTPDWVVDYIIHETIDPLIAEIEMSPAVKVALDNKIKNNSFRDAVLKLRILDPAMGSGHFLVRATEYLADLIAHDPTTETAVKRVPPGLTEADAEIAYWRRKVVESCMFGVDINPLAVELAKLSLWLTCISPTNPLNFLDHHIRTGNALIGSTIEQLSSGKYKIEGLTEALKSSAEVLSKLSSLPSDRFEDIKEKQTIWEKNIEAALLPYHRFFNLRTAFDFGLWHNEAAFASDMEAALKDESKSLKKVDALTGENCFLHWELAFPEIYNSDNSKPGFDVVIGNPPYVRQESLGELKTYLQKRFESYAGTADLYAYFIEKGVNLLKPGGRFGMIVSNKWMRARYGEGLRHFIRQYQIEKIVSFSGLKVFKESTVDTIIMTVCKQERTEPPIYAPIKDLKTNSDALEAEVKALGYPLEESTLAPAGFTLVRSDAQRILDKMREAGTPLEEYVKGRIYNGIKTGFNKTFVIDRRKRDELVAADPASAEIIKPFVVGDNVRKYQINFREKYLILTKIGVEIDNYPAIFKHLKQYRKQLEKRWDKGEHWWELRACDYYEEFEKPKIVWPEIAKESRFTLDSSFYYLNNKCFMIPTFDFYLLGILNSNCVWQFLIAKCSPLGDPDSGGGIELRHIYMAQLPIPSVSPSESKALANLVKTRLELTEKLKEAFTAKQKADIGDEIEEVEREIDASVNRLYGIK